MTNLNPLQLLDAILADWASERARRRVHATILLVLALVTIWLAAGGDWVEALTALVGTLYAASNRANTAAPNVDAAVEVYGTEPDQETGGPDA